MSKFTKKVSTVLVSVATVVSLSGAGALVPVAYGATTAELQAQIDALLASVAALQAQLAGSTTTVSGTVPASLLSSGNLTVGSKGVAVKDLQRFLNGAGFVVAASGAGSVGNETEYFGSLTKAALAKWQAANGVSPAVGYFGPITRTKLSTVSGGVAPVTGTTPAPAPAVPAGSGLTVTLASDQPSSSLAPYDATRIPFTKVNLTASSDGDVTVTALTVQRLGLSEDAGLAGVVLLDENGIQLGLEKALNSDHTVTVGESVVVKAGQTRTFTVAGRRAASGSRGGQTVALAVTAVATAANVNAAFPLTGTTHTINETLTIGTLTSPQAGPLDPGSSQTKEIGTNGYTFSSVRVTAGSAEKIILKSIRWNQSGSAAKSDLANVKSYIDGVGYDTVVSADGKFYTSTFGSGILVDKGFNKEISIKGDVAGGSARKVDFDIDKRSDLYAIGDTFGYGVLPANGTDTSGTDDGAFHSSTNPWFDAYEVHISAGTLTVSKWSEVNAQNVAINLADQPVGGWVVDVKGEQVSVGKFVFRIAVAENSGSAVGLDDIDSIKLVDSTGKTLAGPIDPSATTGDGPITFTDTVTFPVGITNLKMVAKLATDFANNDTIAASTTPDVDWTSVTGQTTGNTITPSPTSAVTGNTMTVKSASLSITVASVPIAQTVIAGTNQFEFARYILDTSSSGEDLRLTSLPIEYNIGAGAVETDLTSCYLYDGTVKLNADTVKNPTAGSSTSFVFDGTGLTLTKGTSKQLSLKCNLKAGAAANATYSWGYDTTASPSPTGLVSGQSVAAADLTENDSPGQSMIVATGGTLNIALDVASPYLIAAPGQEVVLAKLKYTSTVEDVDVKSVALQMTTTASNTPINLVGQQVTLWDGATQVGTATFTSGDTATSSALTPNQFRVPKDGFKILTVKGTVAGISASGPMTRSGDLAKVDYDGDNEGTATYTGGNYGTGVQSGSQINPSNDDSASTGVRVMKAYPTLSLVALSSTLLANGTKDVYKFKVTANNGEIALAKLSFKVSSSTLTATATTFALYAYTDSGFSVADAQLVTTGLINAGSCYVGNGAFIQGDNTKSAPGHIVEIYPDATGCNQSTTTFRISSGESRWFRLQASIASVVSGNTSESLTVQLEGDAAFPTVHQTLDSEDGDMGISGVSAGTGVDDATNNDFIWSPRSTSTSSDLDDQDWTNGYGVVGLPGTNMDQATLSK